MLHKLLHALVTPCHDDDDVTGLLVALLLLLVYVLAFTGWLFTITTTEPMKERHLTLDTSNPSTGVGKNMNKKEHLVGIIANTFAS